MPETYEVGALWILAVCGTLGVDNLFSRSSWTMSTNLYSGINIK